MLDCRTSFAFDRNRPSRLEPYDRISGGVEERRRRPKYIRTLKTSTRGEVPGATERPKREPDMQTRALMRGGAMNGYDTESDRQLRSLESHV